MEKIDKSNEEQIDKQIKRLKIKSIFIAIGIVITIIAIVVVINILRYIKPPIF